MTDNVVKFKKTWVSPVIELEDSDLGFELPDELLALLNLSTGDTIIWEETDTGWLLRKDNG